jgi:hypothetical protein
MQKYRFKLFLFVLVAATIYAACRKTDSQIEKPVSANQESKFFDSHRSADPLEEALVNFIKSKNDKDNFVELVIKRIGFPRWDKAITRPAKSRSRNGRIESDSATLTYIPFVRTHRIM